MTKPDTKGGNKGTGAGAATEAAKGTGAAQGAATGATAGAEAKTRARNALSPQKVLAIAIAGLAAILSREAVAKQLTEPEKAQVQAANKLAADLNAKTIKPIQDRIAAIAKEFAALMPDITKPGTAEKAKELSQELNRKQNQLKALTSAAAAPAE